MGSVGTPEILLVLVIALLLFGPAVDVDDDGTRTFETGRRPIHHAGDLQAVEALPADDLGIGKPTRIHAAGLRLRPPLEAPGLDVERVHGPRLLRGPHVEAQLLGAGPPGLLEDLGVKPKVFYLQKAK